MFVIVPFNNNHCSIIQWPNSTVIGAIDQTKKGWHKIDKLAHSLSLHDNYFNYYNIVFEVNVSKERQLYVS